MMEDLADAVNGAAGSDEYINGAARKVAAGVRAGKAYPDAAPIDNQLHSLVKLPVVVARYVGAAPTASAHKCRHVSVIPMITVLGVPSLAVTHRVSSRPRGM